MKNPIILAIVGLLFVGATLTVLAQQEQGPKTPSANLVASNAQEKERPEPTLSPMMLQISNACADEQAALAKLQTRLETATGESEILAVIREIEEVKIQTEIRILEIQADFARQEGNIEKAELIEAAIEEIIAGPPAGVPQPRQAPAREPETP